ncbi:MAG: DUF3261 domain-containing protein [Treponema sp.]|nr:DUF3261 domain-containing protein [Treponema sp.]
MINFCSCNTATSAADSQPFVYLTNRSKYLLLPSENIKNPMDMIQHISASYRSKNYFFNAWVKADKTGMDMTILNELGTSMGDLSYRDGIVSFSSSVFPASVKPEYIVADYQLCFYDDLPLRRALENCGLLLESTEVSRRVFQGKAVIIEIKKSSGVVQFVNHLRGYSYTLEGDFE